MKHLAALLLLIFSCGLVGCQKTSDSAQEPKKPSSALDANKTVQKGNGSDEVKTAVGSVTSQPVKQPSIVFTEVRADKRHFDPSKKQLVSVYFSINQKADVSLNIYDGRDKKVKTIQAKNLEAGQHVLQWDGKDEHDRIVPPEAYSHTLSAIDQEGLKTTHDLTDLTGQKQVPVTDIQWNQQQKTISYFLPEPSRVNIRLGLKDGGPYMRTLINWAPRFAGKHVEPWDGMDASNIINIAEHSKLMNNIMAYALPENTVFVGDIASSTQPSFVETASLPEREKTKKSVNQIKRMYFHTDQPLESRGDIETYISIVGDYVKDKKGRWVVSGLVPIRFDVSDKDRPLLLKRRFEPVFYVDGTFAFENEVGFLPMTWKWDSSKVNEGEHFITINIRGYEGNFGTATLKVWVKHEQKVDKPS